LFIGNHFSHFEFRIPNFVSAFRFSHLDQRVPSSFAAWPPWLVVACAVVVAALVIWILAKSLKLILWLLLIAVLAACAVVAARLIFK
jgi:hypothetical protein